MNAFQMTGELAVALVLIGAILLVAAKGAAVGLPARFASLSVRAHFPRQRRTRMELVEKLPLGPQHSLFLVRLGTSLVLIATSPGACQLKPAEGLTIPETE